MKINGPVNITRLEGNIDNIKKVLYIFSDIHYEPYYQSNCNEDEAVDIDYFLGKTFLELNQTIDFFLEIDNNIINDYKEPLKIRYIDNLSQFFSRNFNITSNKLVKKSEKYKYVRFHFSDIRHDNYIIQEYLDIIFSIYFDENIYTFIINLNNNTKFLNNSKQKLEKLNNISTKLLEYFYKDYYINKIKNKINNKNVKTILNNYLDLFYNNLKNIKTITTTYYNEIVKITNNYKKFEEPNMNEYIKKIFIPIIELNNRYLFDSSIQKILLMDLYFLRRFLDKDYIKNAILYCGSLHSISIIYILVNHFKFKITHSTSNINNINTKIKNNDYINVIYNGDQTLINNKTIIQCSDISSFPKNFL